MEQTTYWLVLDSRYKRVTDSPARFTMDLQNANKSTDMRGNRFYLGKINPSKYYSLFQSSKIVSVELYDFEIPNFLSEVSNVNMIPRLYLRIPEIPNNVVTSFEKGFFAVLDYNDNPKTEFLTRKAQTETFKTYVNKGLVEINKLTMEIYDGTNHLVDFGPDSFSITAVNPSTGLEDFTYSFDQSTMTKTIEFSFDPAPYDSQNEVISKLDAGKDQILIIDPMLRIKYRDVIGNIYYYDTITELPYNPVNGYVFVVSLTSDSIRISFKEHNYGVFYNVNRTLINESTGDEVVFNNQQLQYIGITNIRDGIMVIDKTQVKIILKVTMDHRFK